VEEYDAVGVKCGSGVSCFSRDEKGGVADGR